MYKIPL